jgi:hypothetical protein
MLGSAYGVNFRNACYDLVQKLLSENFKIKVCNIIIFLVALYGCETWSLTLRRNILRAFENRALRRICRPRRNEVVGGWVKLHNGELRKLYFSPSIMRMIKSMKVRWVGLVARLERRVIRIGYWWKPQRERDH